AWEALEEDGHVRSGQGRRFYPCAARGTRVYPKALACLAIVVTLRSRYCASYASRPCWTYALPWRNRLETRRASLDAVAVMALGVPRRAFSRRKKAPKALWEWCKVRAARRRATVTRCAPGRTRRDSTLPPEILCWGHNPRQLQKCFTLGHRVLS